MKQSLLAGLYLLFGIFSKLVFSQSLIMLDEGINTDQRWNVPINLQGRQGCMSIATIFSSAIGSRKLTHGALCNELTSTTIFFWFRK